MMTVRDSFTGFTVELRRPMRSWNSTLAAADAYICQHSISRCSRNPFHSLFFQGSAKECFNKHQQSAHLSYNLKAMLIWADKARRNCTSSGLVRRGNFQGTGCATQLTEMSAIKQYKSPGRFFLLTKRHRCVPDFIAICWPWCLH